MMDISHYEPEFPFVLIENTYTDEQVNLILNELKSFYEKNIFLEPSKTGSAMRKDGKMLKKNKSIFLDDFYIKNRDNSNILKLNRILCNNLSSILSLSESWYFRYAANRRFAEDFTLVSYYGNSDDYKIHHDLAHITCLTWFYQKPKKFRGGELTLYSSNSREVIKCNNNRTVIFPSIVNHSVSEVIMDSVDDEKGLGRFCITQFFQL